MGKTVEVPRYCILSGRFSEEENKLFRQMADERELSISDMVREAMELWREKSTSPTDAQGAKK